MKKKNITKKKNRIVGSMTFGEAIAIKPSIAKVLAEEGMFCGCCPMAMMETIEQGERAHQVDVKKIIKKLNK